MFHNTNATNNYWSSGVSDLNIGKAILRNLGCLLSQLCMFLQPNERKLENFRVGQDLIPWPLRLRCRCSAL